MTQQEFSNMFNVYCAFDENSILYWYSSALIEPSEKFGEWRFLTNENKFGRVPSIVERKKCDNWVDSLTCPIWIPKEGEPVALYDTGSKIFCIHVFNRDNMGSHCNTEIMWGNIAKYSGQLDLRVEAIRNEPHYKKDGKICSE